MFGKLRIWISLIFLAAIFGLAPSAQATVRKAHLADAGTFFAWLTDGIDDDTATALRREVPAPVLFLIRGVAGRHYRRRIAPTWA